MTNAEQFQHDSLAILIDELITDEELRDSFLRDPERTLRFASDWALPLSESELQSLRVPAYRILDRVTEQLAARL